MSASSRNFSAARAAFGGTPENAGNGPLGNIQFQVGPDGTLRFVPVQTPSSTSEQTSTNVPQDPESIARAEERARLAEEQWNRYREMKNAEKMAKIPPPPKPQMITYPLADREATYPIEIPKDPNWVWVSHRDHPGQWRRIGSPIKEEEVGSTYFREANRPQTYQPIHSGLNAGQESFMTDDELRGILKKWNLPTEGDRYSIFDRVVRVKTNPTVMEKVATGNAPLTEQERQYVLGGDRYPKSANLLQAEREQGIRDRKAFLARKSQQPQTNAPNQPTVNTQMGGTTTTTTTTQPPNVVEPPAPQKPQGPLYGGTMRLGDEAPMSTSVMGNGATQTQTMTQPNLYSRIMPQANPQANAGAAAAEEAGIMGGMDMMASRAMPILNMVFLGKMLTDSMTADSKEKKMQQQQLMYRT